MCGKDTKNEKNFLEQSVKAGKEKELKDLKERNLPKYTELLKEYGQTYPVSISERERAQFF